MFLPSFMGFDKAGFGDPDALAFFARVTAAGGSLTNTEKAAVTTLVTDLKGYGIWSSMKAIYPMVGASAAACAQNLKSSSFTGTFSSGWTFASTGVTPNGTSAYFDTALNSSTNLTQTSISFGIYYRNNITAVPIEGTLGGGFALAISPRITTTNYSLGTINLISVADSIAGLKAVCRVGSTVTAYRNGSSVGTSTDANTLASLNTYLGALNQNGSPNFYSSNQEAFAFLGDGLNATQNGNFYTAIQAFQTTLSRQV
jgi:hypothetical protein